MTIAEKIKMFDLLKKEEKVHSLAVKFKVTKRMTLL